MKRKILISANPFENRVAMLEDGKVAEFYVELAENPSLVGNIYLGKVKDILPGMEAAFVDIGLARNAFLYVEEVIDESGVRGGRIEKRLHAGQDLMVQVTRNAIQNKGARVTADITLPGRHLVFLPFSKKAGISRRLPDEKRESWRATIEKIRLRGAGFIIRTAAGKADLDTVKRELRYLQRVWRKVKAASETTRAPSLLHEEAKLPTKVVRDVFVDDFDSLVIDSQAQHAELIKCLKRFAPHLIKKSSLYRDNIPLFEAYGVDKQLEQSLGKRVWLPSGGHINVDTTEALTAIDVNTGRYVGKSSLQETIFKTNLEAAEVVAGQLRLRDLSGLIVIDFIDMEEVKKRDKVFSVFKKSLEKDRAKSRLVDFSALGLVEMTRKGVFDGSHSHKTVCPTCRGWGEILATEDLAADVYRKVAGILSRGTSAAYLISVSPNVFDYFQERQDYLKGLRRDYGKSVYFSPSDVANGSSAEVLAEGLAKDVKNRWKKLVSV